MYLFINPGTGTLYIHRLHNLPQIKLQFLEWNIKNSYLNSMHPMPQALYDGIVPLFYSHLLQNHSTQKVHERLQGF
jgi:hypothetical protein